MRPWPAEDLRTIAETTDVSVSPIREDGTIYATPTRVWSLVVDGQVYARAAHGVQSSWDRAAITQRAGRVRVADRDFDVTFAPAHARRAPAHGPSWANRFALAPMTNKQSHDDGTLSGAGYEWQVARGRGWFGLVKTCAAYVADAGRTGTGQPGIASDEHLRGLTPPAKGLKATGTRPLVQLHHGGLRAGPSMVGRRVAPFDDPETGTGAMSGDDVRQMVESYVAAAVRAEQAGLDGVELHGARGLTHHRSNQARSRVLGFDSSKETT